MEKAEGAFRTIGEVAEMLGLPQHILRYWETRFPQLKPLQRAGNRRYYRPADVVLVKRIDQWLNRDGYTVKGVQKLLKDKVEPEPVVEVKVEVSSDPLRAIRDQLARALAEDGA